MDLGSCAECDVVWNWCHAGTLFLGNGCFAPRAWEVGPDRGLGGTCVLARGKGSQGELGLLGFTC